jgi:hypothetical protein
MGLRHALWTADAHAHARCGVVLSFISLTITRSTHALRAGRKKEDAGPGVAKQGLQAAGRTRTAEMVERLSQRISNRLPPNSAAQQLTIRLSQRASARISRLERASFAVDQRVSQRVSQIQRNSRISRISFTSGPAARYSARVEPCNASCGASTRASVDSTCSQVEPYNDNQPPPIELACSWSGNKSRASMARQISTM